MNFTLRGRYPAAGSGASSPVSAAATASVRMGMRAARKAPASMICAASVGGRRLSSPGEARDGAAPRHGRLEPFGLAHRRIAAPAAAGRDAAKEYRRAARRAAPTVGAAHQLDSAPSLLRGHERTFVR